MKKRKLLAKRPKAKNGQKRQVTIKHILLPEELVAELQLYKQAYSDVLNQKVTWEQMFHRWMENIGRFDPDVKLRVEAIKTPVITPEQKAEQQVEQSSLERIFSVDPTEGEVWKMKYFFKKDGEEIEAYIGDRTTFFCHYLGKNVGISTMIREGWKLYNDAGVEIMKEQAIKIHDIIKKRK